MNTTGSRQRYNFERYDKVFSRGGYQALGAPWFMPTYNRINHSGGEICWGAYIQIKLNFD